MTESSPQHDEMLISLIQQGLEMRQTAGGCDRFCKGGLFVTYHRGGIGLGLLRRSERGDEPR